MATTNGKKLNQTRLSSYFTGCVKSIPSEPKILRKPKTVNMRRRLSFPSVSSSSTGEKKVHKGRRYLSSLSPENLQLIASIPKRKLPAPIFSDDEDSENDFSQDSSPTNNVGFDGLSNATKPKVPLSLNRPSIIKTSPKSRVNWKPSTTSSSSIVDDNDNSITNTSNIKHINILQDLVIQTPKKSPERNPSQSELSRVKDEGKKVNYEQLRVMREFFINVLQHDHLKNLLSADDQEFLYKFFNLERDFQYVCVKLFLWKSMWYNIFKFTERLGLSMTDSHISAMYKCLKEEDYVDTDYMNEDLFTLLDLLSLKDVRDIGRSFRLPNLTGPKETLTTKLIKLCKTQITLTNMMNTEAILRKRIEEKMGHCIKISSRLRRCLYSIYLLNTFTNSTLTHPQDYCTNVSYFNIVFPIYTVENFNIFYTPHEFTRFADAVQLRMELDRAIDKRNITFVFEICSCAFDMLKNLNGTYDDTREPYLERFTPNAQYIYILTSGSKHITNSHHEQVMIWFEYLLSQEFCKHKRGDWYSQLALIYSLYNKNYEKAAKLVIQAFQSKSEEFTDIQLHELAHRGKMLNKKTYHLSSLFHDQIAALSPASCDRDWPEDFFDCKSVQNNDPGRRRMYVHQLENGDVNLLTVEQTALQYYRGAGYPCGVHCEGSLIIASFCLFFWDLIYNEYVKGTFVSKLQSVPLDLYGKYFYINRREAIEDRLRDIEENWDDDFMRKRLLDNWALHSHEQSLCSIQSVIESPETLFTVTVCIGRGVLTKIFRRLVMNFKAHHSGFPDLILWNLEEKKVKFVEVKSENDKLSIKQKLWLNYLIDIGANVAVCRVEPKASKKRKVCTMNTQPSTSK